MIRASPPNETHRNPRQALHTDDDTRAEEGETRREAFYKTGTFARPPSWPPTSFGSYSPLATCRVPPILDVIPVFLHYLARGRAMLSGQAKGKSKDLGMGCMKPVPCHWLGR